MSAPKPLILFNPTKKTLNIWTITVDGDFSVTFSNCPSALPEGSGCELDVVFGPTGAGVRTSTLTITDDSVQSPHKIKISGIGVPVQMTSISLAPATPTIPKGVPQQFVATGNFNNGTSQDLTASASWASTAPGIVSIGAGGLATAISQGSATIKATSGALTGSTVVTVGPPVLQSIRITAQFGSFPKGLTQQLVATGIMTDGTTIDITNSVQWYSTNTGVLTINSSGVATGVSIGSAGIGCSLGSVNGGYPSQLHVTAPIVVSAVITPANPSIPLNYSLQLRASGTYSDGSTADVTNQAYWSPMGPVVSSPNPGVVTVEVFIAGIWMGKTTVEFGGVFSPVSSMTTNRVLHAATLLNNGKVLLTGGSTDAGCCSKLASAELYDPGSKSFAPTGAMTGARRRHTATLLNNGKVLIVGNDFADTTAELYDPATGAFTSTGSLAAGRSGHSSTVLLNGQVLIAGGSGATAELYNPATGSFSATGTMMSPRQFHTATLLNNGQVLIAGGTGVSGSLTSAEIYDPGAGTFSSVGMMTIPRAYHRATLLNGGKVLLTGGVTNAGSTATAEFYDPPTGLFTATGAMNSARNTHTATLLTSGQVLVISGQAESGLLSSSEKYDPVLGVFSPTGSTDLIHFNNTRVGHTATLLREGKILVTGGVPSGNPGLYEPSLFTPPGLTQITLTPLDANLLLGESQRFVATGTFNTGGSQTLNSVIWASGNDAVVSISADPGNPGVAIGSGSGQAVIGAVAGRFINGALDFPVGSAQVTVH